MFIDTGVMPTFELASEKYRDSIIEMYIHDIEDNQNSARKFADDLIQRFKTILCITNDEIIGTISWEVRGGLEDGIVELVAMGVKSMHRRKGIGLNLFTKMLDDAKALFSESNLELRIVYLFMEYQNQTARKFYESLGFTEDSRLSKFYPSDDASIWVLRL
jgi:ribosomal protein S18 acetylase RimI-like enzyme